MRRRQPAPKPRPTRPIDRAAHRVCKAVHAFDGRCACEAAGGRACSPMTYAATMAVSALLGDAARHRLPEVLDGAAELVVRARRREGTTP